MPAASLHIGQTLYHRYRLEQQAGQGGMAVVYKAWDLQHERMVALKVPRPQTPALLETQGEG